MSKNKKQTSDKQQNGNDFIADVMFRNFSKMFFWFGIEFFDARLKEYGGFNHWIAKLFNYKYTYFIVCFEKQLKFEIVNETDDVWYDGYHNHIFIGFISIYYGT